MKNKLTLEINDFGPINRAKIDMGKINIIAGPNASGKTTASKLLYSIIASTCTIGNDFIKELFYVHLNNTMPKLAQYVKTDDAFKDLYEHYNLLDKNTDLDSYLSQDFAEKIKRSYNSSELNSKELRTKLSDALFFSNLFSIYGNDLKSSEILYHLLYAEFNYQCEMMDEWNQSKITFHSEDTNFNVNIQLPLKNYTLENVENSNIKPMVTEDLLINDIVYIDTPYILDFFSKNSNLFIKPKYYFHPMKSHFLFHQKDLIRKLSLEVNDIKLSSYNKDLLKLFDFQGNIEYDKNDNDFFYKEENYKYSMPITASGLKTVNILKLLLKNGLDNNSIIIMDEPEVHLHPDWQLILAELIVKLSKEGDIIFYINSHSPQFIEAIEAYSELYEYEESTNFYITEPDSEEKSKFNFKKIQRKNLKEIYSHLGNIFEKIDEVKGKTEARKILKGLNHE